MALTTGRCGAGAVIAACSPALNAVAMASSMRAVAFALQPELWEPTIRYAVHPLQPTMAVSAGGNTVVAPCWR